MRLWRAIPAAAELVGAGFVLLFTVALLGARRLSLLRRQPRQARLLVINSAYSLYRLRVRQAEHTVTCRDLNGYFSHVWSVHPMVGASPDEPRETIYGQPTFTPIAQRHTMVEGKLGRFQRWSHLPRLNFVVSQAELTLRLDRLCRREGIGLIRGDPYYNGLLALLLGRLNRVPVELRINANHDAIYEAVGGLAYPRIFRWRWLEKRVAKFTLSRGDLIVVGSDDNRGFALANGARPERIAYIGNWSMINPVHLEPPERRAPASGEFGLGDRPLLVCVTRLERVKHPEDVLTALAEARAVNPRLAGILVGDGAMHDQLRALSDDLDLDGSLVLAGDRDQAWLARILTRANVIVAPLAGLALVEAALSATPIVAYDVEWHAELITSGETGLLVPYRDTEALARAVVALVADPERARALGARARSSVLDLMRPDELLRHERAQASRLLARNTSGA